MFRRGSSELARVERSKIPRSSGKRSSPWPAGTCKPQKRSQPLAHGCLKPTFERPAPETVESDVDQLPDAPKTAESDAALCQNASKMVDSGIDFRYFSRCRGMDGSTSSAKCRTSVFTGRRSTFKGSQTLRTNRKATKFNERSLRQ